MEIIIETPRLALKEFQLSDARHMYELNLDPEVLKYTGDPPFVSLEEAASFLKNYQDYEKNGFGRWSVFLKPQMEYVGWSGLKLNEEKLVDIGFRFSRRYWNQGFATESARACLKYGFEDLQLKKIVGRAAKANLASIRVLQKIGMTYWKDAPFEGVEDAVYYVIEKN